MTKHPEYFFKCFSVIESNIEKVSVETFLFKSVAHFKIQLFVLLMSEVFSAIYILDIIHLTKVGLVKILSHSVVCEFVY